MASFLYGAYLRKLKLVSCCTLSVNISHAQCVLQFPHMSLQSIVSKVTKHKVSKQAKADAAVIVSTFASFDVPMELVEIIDGLVTSRFRMRLKKPVRMSAIREFADDLRYALGVKR